MPRPSFLEALGKSSTFSFSVVAVPGGSEQAIFMEGGQNSPKWHWGKEPKVRKAAFPTREMRNHVLGWRCLVAKGTAWPGRDSALGRAQDQTVGSFHLFSPGTNSRGHSLFWVLNT